MNVRRQIERDWRRSEGNHADEQPTGAPREQDGDCGAHQRQQAALDHELTHDASAARADSQSDRDLTLPCGCAGQQQAGDVRGRDEQHEHRDRHQQEQRPHIQRPEIRPACSARG